MKLHHSGEIVAATPITAGTIVHHRTRAIRGKNDHRHDGKPTTAHPGCVPKPATSSRDEKPGWIEMSATRALHLGAILCDMCAAAPDIADTVPSAGVTA